jgi:hypothetical protein
MPESACVANLKLKDTGTAAYQRLNAGITCCS